eukprot:135883-Rhodomonas_salina.1
MPSKSSMKIPEIYRIRSLNSLSGSELGYSQATAGVTRNTGSIGFLQNSKLLGQKLSKVSESCCKELALGSY